VLPTGGSVIGRAPWAEAHPGDRATAELLWRRLADSHADISLEFRVWHPGSRPQWIGLDARPARSADGRVIGYAGIAVDRTAAVNDRLLLRQLTGVVAVSTDAVVVVDRNGAPVYTNDAALALFGVDVPSDMIRNPSARVLMRQIRDQLPRELMTASSSGSWTGEVGFRSPDGFERVLSIDIAAQRDANGIVEYWGGIMRDITAARQLQRELTRQANHDSLTGLPNRVLAQRTAIAAIERNRALRENVAVLFIDVDNLKDVNDGIGHGVGDSLLVHVAHRLTYAVRPADMVARIGGDEFVVLCRGEIDEDTAMELAERIRAALAGRMMVEGNEIDVSISVGVAVSSQHDLDATSAAEAADELLHNADIAMYVAKRRGRSRCELYTAAMRADAARRRRLSDDLETAAARGQLHLAYQPIQSTYSGRVVGAEALLRWRHPEQGEMMPAEFVSLAEESGAIAPIGDWVMDQACRDTRAWLDADLVQRTFSVHVNVSGRQLADGAFVERVVAALQRNDLAASHLTLDFDEVDVHDDSMRTLNALRRIGVRLSVDRFGRGRSSLTMLRTSQADVLKLDGSIARSLAEGGADDPMVRAIIQLAHALGMQVVAEWVSTPDQLQRLRALGCDMVQGYLLGEPTTAELFADSIS
jgi:diguanylate cyclase (GGDEF)-like protein/PAS domain S-box-containing protein